MSRDEIVSRFKAWLDNLLAGEELPSGLDAEMLAAVAGHAAEEQRRCDSYALWAAVTALTQEIKLQGRAFKQLNDAFRQREHILEQEIERRNQRQILDALLDLRDRLGRGIDSVRATTRTEARPSGSAREGWLARVFRSSRQDRTPDIVAAFQKGYELAIERLDQILGEFHAREIPCTGLSFDPQCMNAVDKEESIEVPEGTVLEVYRRGYEWNGEIYRCAQVKVSCAPEEKQK